MSDDGWGFADMYGMDEPGDDDASELVDVASEDWRNIMVIGRATKTGVYGETLSLVGHARYLADELGCRVEVLLIGTDLDAATETLGKYPVDNVYRVAVPDYAPLDQTATVVAEAVRKRRPELVLAFQSRSGDAIIPYAANRMGAGFALGASEVSIDTMERTTRVVHQGKNPEFRIVTEMLAAPAFVSVQRGLFRAPMEDPYATTKIHDLDIDVGKVADVKVLGHNDPPVPTVETAERVVVAGARIRGTNDLDAARKLAEALNAVFGVTQAVVDRGLSDSDPIIGVLDRKTSAAKLVVGVGCTGSLEMLEAVAGAGTLVAVASGDNDPINDKAAYRVAGSVQDAVQAVIDSL